MNLLRAIGMGEKGKAPFVEWGQLRMILVVMIPTVIYVALISNPWFSLGIYTASAIYIAMFMYFLGKYCWRKIVPVSVGHDGVLLPDVRDLVQGAPAQGAARSGFRVRLRGRAKWKRSSP